MAVDLANTTPLDLEHPHLNSPALTAADVTEFLAKLQGNILKSHGRDHLEIRFLQLPAATTKAEVKSLLAVLATLVTNAATQAAQTIRNVAGAPEEPFVSVWLTQHCLRRLGRSAVTEKDWLKDTVFWSDNIPVQTGRGTDAVYGPLADPVGIAVLVAHDDPAGAGNHWTGTILPALAPLTGWQLHPTIETGRVLRAKRRVGGGGAPVPVAVEHFGYMDGISRPRILLSDPATAPWNSFRPLGQVLVSEAALGGANAFGSYFTLQKIEQNPQAFRAAARATGDEEAFCAQAMGRYRDGRPLVPTAAGNLNGFNYPSPPPATDGCPFHAHIRRANPRDSASPVEETKVLFPRRSITYGVRADVDQDGCLDETAAAPAGRVGLLFMACMAQPAAQFKVTVNRWLLAPDFPVPGTGQPDPVIHGRDAAGVPFVTSHGGMNFYAPSLAALLRL